MWYQVSFQYILKDKNLKDYLWSLVICPVYEQSFHCISFYKLEISTMSSILRLKFHVYVFWNMHSKMLIKTRICDII
jgi:hypothetical protein